jgi:hypothetical protein
MREIALSRGLVALVDDHNFDWLNRWKWHAHKADKIWYARRNEGRGETRTTVLMHREILQLRGGSRGDHKDGNGLNNLEENIRAADAMTNGQNRRPNAGRSLKGVSFHKGSWIARITVGGVTKHLGCFSSEESAARAYDAAALIYFGTFARLNFPGDA